MRMLKNDLFNLKNKVCLITGGAGLLGSNFSRVLAERGASVVILDIDSAKGGKLAEEIQRSVKNSKVMFQKCDITDAASVRSLIKNALRKFKRIDVLVNNAYPKNKNYGRLFEDVTYEDFCENINLHLGGYFLITKEVSQVMKKQKSGNIINLASIYGFAAPDFDLYSGTKMTMPVEYAAIKGGVINLTKYLASYLGKYGIRVNALSPGGVFNNQSEEFVKKYSSQVVLGNRMASGKDLEGAMVFLASDASGYMTGQNLIIDGGWTL
jgi:NAD(P)-dependent dehydrogenase (short-subunit alcohol dehydrogenase family)